LIKNSPYGIISAFIYSRKFSHKTNQLFSLFGLILIIISIAFLDERIIPPFPNLYTLIPTCGATLIIVFGEKNTLVGYLLSSYPLRWIGLISYSAYLWHQPLLVFNRLQSKQKLEIFTNMKIVSAIFALSFLSYFFIEKPFRNKERFSRNKIFTIAGLAALLTLTIALVLTKAANYRLLPSNNETDTYLSDLRNYAGLTYTIGYYTEFLKTKETFSNTAPTFNRRIALIGDSFAADFYNMVIEGKYLTNYEICFYHIMNPCQIYLGEEDRSQFIEPQFQQACTNAFDIKYALPIIRLANIIILASNWRDWSAHRLPSTLESLNLTKSQRLFVVGAKNWGLVNPNLYVDKSILYRIEQYQHPTPVIAQTNDLLEKTIDKSVFINMQKMICTGPDGTCPLFTPKGKLITFDGTHFTKYGALYVGNIVFNNKPLNELK
jgi:hypothetical protein